LSKVSFAQRFGFEKRVPINNDFPETARTALAYLLDDLANRDYEKIRPKQAIIAELCRTGRQKSIDENQSEVFFDQALWHLEKMTWEQIYTFCERAYLKLLAPIGNTNYDINSDYWEEEMPLGEVQKYFEAEINNILVEENLAYHFVNGQFQRRGRAQTQKNIQRVGTVLANPDLADARNHYNRARAFFDQRPEPDVQNCVKEAVCALESCVFTLSKQSNSNNFTKTIKQIEKIPPTISEGIVKLYAYRGDAKGVAHAAPQGSQVSEIEAELVLSLVASYITYIVDLLTYPYDEVPF